MPLGSVMPCRPMCAMPLCVMSMVRFRQLQRSVRRIGNGEGYRKKTEQKHTQNSSHKTLFGLVSTHHHSYFIPNPAGLDYSSKGGSN